MADQMRLLRMRSRKDAGNIISYIIEVSNGAECWAVTRRYSQFRRCHVQLLEHFGAADLPPFPPKEPIFQKLRGNEEHISFLRQREYELQNYLVGLLQQPGICSSPPLQTLLDVPSRFASRGGGSAVSSGSHPVDEEQGVASFSGFRVRLTGEPGGLEVVIRAGSHADASLRPQSVHLTLQELADDEGKLETSEQRLEEVLEFLDDMQVRKRLSLPPGTFWEVTAYGTTASGLVGSAVCLRVRAPGERELADLPASAIASFSASEGSPFARERLSSTASTDSQARVTLKCIGCAGSMVWCVGHCSEGGYVGGQFVCNSGSQCKNASGPLQEGFRWNCPRCLNDFCGSCEPEPIGAPSLLHRKVEADQLASEQTSQTDEERLEVRDESMEADSLAVEEASRLEAERAEREEANRLAAEEASKLEAERLESERAAKAEAERLEAERAEREKADLLAAELAAQADAERLAAEEASKLEAERLESERAAKAEAERLEAEGAEREKADLLAAELAAQADAERLAAEEASKLEAERLESERAAKAEAERLEAERIEKLEAERLAAEAEAARLAAESAKIEELLEAERVAAEQLASEATVTDNPQSAVEIVEPAEVEALEREQSRASEQVSIGDNQQESIPSEFSETEDDRGGIPPGEGFRRARITKVDEEFHEAACSKASVKRSNTRLPLGPEDHRVVSARGNVAATYLKNVEEKSLQVIEKAPYRFEAVDGEKRTVPLRFSARSVGHGEDAVARNTRKDAEELDQTRRAKEISKLQKEEQSVAEWISEVTGHPDVLAAVRGETTLQAAIQSGEALCDIINAVWPERITGILRGEVKPIKRVDNVQKFCKACKDVGVEDYVVFAPLDLAMGAKEVNVIPCLFALNALFPRDYEGSRLTEYFEQAPLRHGRLEDIEEDTGTQE